VVTNEALDTQLAGLTRLKSLAQDLVSLADLAQVVKELQAERDRLRERVEQLEAECERLRAERSQFMHAWADVAVTEDDLECRSLEPGGGPLSAVLQRLEKT